LLVAEPDLFVMSDFHISLPSFGYVASSVRWSWSGEPDGKGASIPTARCTCTVSRTAHEPLRLCNPIGRLPDPGRSRPRSVRPRWLPGCPLRETAKVPAR